MSDIPEETPTGTPPLTMEQLAALNPEDLEALHVATLTEQERRRDVEVIPDQIEHLTQRYNQARGPRWDELPAAIQAYRNRHPHA